MDVPGGGATDRRKTLAEERSDGVRATTTEGRRVFRGIPQAGLALGDRTQKKDFFWVRGGERKKWIFFSFDGGGWVVAGAKNSFPDGVLIRGSGLV
jgi:hypothetical protein